MGYLDNYDTFKSTKVTEQANPADMTALKTAMEAALTAKNNKQNELTLAEKNYQTAQKAYNDALSSSVDAQNQKSAAEAEAAKNIPTPAA
jgi:hypothetical protein